MNEHQMSTKVSVIIPIYNASAYIERCIHSLLSQTFKDYELLLVDDCSKDNSVSIAKSLLSTCECRINYRIISIKKNGGVSEARNIGLAEAKGDWVVFLDGDDLVDDIMLESLYLKTLENDLDVVFCNFCKIKENIEEKDLSKFVGIQNSDLVLKAVLLGNESAYIWRCIIKKELLIENRIIFPPKLPLFEDALFLIDVLLKSEKVYFSSDILYNYFINPTSAIHRFDNGLLLLPDYLRQLLRSINQKEKWVYVNTCVYWACVRTSQYSSDIDIIFSMLLKCRSLVTLKSLYLFQKNKRLKGITFGLFLLKVSPKLFYRHFRNYRD